MKTRANRPSPAAAGLDQLRRTGHKGRLILPHRAIGRLHLPKHRLVTGTAIALLFTLALLALNPFVAAGWSAVLSGWLQALALPGLNIVPAPAGVDWLSLPVPLVEVPTLPTQAGPPLVHAAVIAVGWWLAGRLPDAARPAAYLLRFALLIHGVSVLYFWLWPASFLHSVADHTVDGLRQTWALILMTPWIHLGTYSLFPYPVRQSVALTLLTLGYLLVLAPLQYALHVAVMVHLGLVMMPLLYLLFGIMLAIVGFVALYGWAMSWRPPDDGRN